MAKFVGLIPGKPAKAPADTSASKKDSSTSAPKSSGVKASKKAKASKPAKAPADTSASKDAQENAQTDGNSVED